MTEVEQIEKLIAQYKRGLMTRDEFWVFLLQIRADVTRVELTTDVERFHQQNPMGWRG